MIVAPKTAVNNIIAMQITRDNVITIADLPCFKHVQLSYTNGSARLTTHSGVTEWYLVWGHWVVYQRELGVRILAPTEFNANFKEVS